MFKVEGDNIKKKDVSQHFKSSYNKVAGDYDFTRYEKGHGKLFKDLSNRLAVQQINDLAEGSDEDLLILDFATGTGKLACALTSVRGIKIIGFDISFNMLSEALSSTENKNGKVSWVNGDGLRMPFSDNTFNHIISFKFLHIMENIHHYDFLKELHRVLKPNGKLIMDCNNGLFGLLLHVRDKKYRRKLTRFYWPYHKYTLYKEFNLVDIIGEWFPFTGFWLKVSSHLAKGLNKVSKHFPFNFLCSKLVLVFQKK